MGYSGTKKNKRNDEEEKKKYKIILFSLETFTSVTQLNCFNTYTNVVITRYV